MGKRVADREAEIDAERRQVGEAAIAIGSRLSVGVFEQGGDDRCPRMLVQTRQQQRQGVAVARAAAFGSRVVILDEPTAALGVKESRRVLDLILDVKRRGLAIVLISHNMPHVFEVCDRIHIHRLGRRLTVVEPKQISMSDAVAMMTGAMATPTQRIAV